MKISNGLKSFIMFEKKQNSQTDLHTFHLNICGLKHIMDKLMRMLDNCDRSPYIICLSEHYLVDHKLLMIKPNNYYLVSRL
jgi:hypothetical protein